MLVIPTPAIGAFLDARAGAEARVTTCPQRRAAGTCTDCANGLKRTIDLLAYRALTYGLDATHIVGSGVGKRGLSAAGCGFDA
jgi:hypothetical protein